MEGKGEEESRDRKNEEKGIEREKNGKRGGEGETGGGRGGIEL